jgi:hypothetical protein
MKGWSPLAICALFVLGPLAFGVATVAFFALLGRCL